MYINLFLSILRDIIFMTYYFLLLFITFYYFIIEQLEINKFQICKIRPTQYTNDYIL